MNKQELIDKLKRNLTVMSEIKGSEYDKGYNWATKQHLVMIAGLDEPEKPVVPQYVADFYESIKDDFEDGVYELCIQLYNCDLDGRINFWFGCNDNKPIETLVKMKLYGYEVEKEKLYTVEIPNPNGFIRLVLCKDCDGDGYTVPVVWDNDYACFSVDWGSNMLTSFDYLEEFYTDLKDIEVIGNIYENLSLIR